MSATVSAMNTIRRITYLVVAAIAFQVVHFGEHLAQITHWAIHPSAPPWLTPWAADARDALSGDPAVGVELLHLLGNAFFLVGLVAMWLLPAAQGAARADVRIATGLQVVHVLEHVALTVTLTLGGTALGISTGFGTLSGGALSSYRVVWHFVFNLVVTAYAVRALARAQNEGLVTSYLEQPAET